MKYVILFLLAGIIGCASAPKQSTPFLCIHPAVNGGQPFNLPDNAYWSPTSRVTFTSGNITYTLSGIICIKATEAN